MKKVLLLIFSIIIFLVAKKATGQYVPHYSLFHSNPYIYNVAYAGISGKINAMALIKYQWVGITDAPRAFLLTGSGPLRNKKNISLGGKIYYDQTGPTVRSGASVSYTQTFKLSENLKLNFGAALGILRYSLDFQKLKSLSSSNDALFTRTDVSSQLYPDIELGFALHNKNFTFGGSYRHPINNDINSLVNATNLNGTLIPHYFILGSYSKDFGEKFNVKPVLLVKGTQTPDFQAALAVKVTYDKKIWLAPEYNYNTHFGGSIGVDLKQYEIGFVYTYSGTNSRINNAVSLSNYEINLKIKFDKLN